MTVVVVVKSMTTTMTTEANTDDLLTHPNLIP